jgi:hypothetical protein
MNAAAQTSGLPNHSTDENRLRAVLRWLVALVIIHCLIAAGRKLAGALYKPSGPDDSFLAAHFGTTDRAQILARITCALHRAAALEDELFACHPTEQGFPIEAIRARIVAICQDLGLFPRAAVRGRAHRFVGADFKPVPTTRVRIQPTLVRPHRATATGPPNPSLRAPQSDAKQSPSFVRTDRRGCTPGASPGVHPRLAY